MDSPSSTTTSIKKPCFIGEDNGLASIAHFSTIKPNHNHNHENHRNNNHNNINNNNNGYFVDYENHMMRRRNSLRSISSLSNNSTSNVSSSSTRTPVFSPRSRFDEFCSPHFLESCALCRKPLGGNRDIFMYRGDTPFCSEECRQEQIEMDEAKEKNLKLKALRSKKEAKKSTSSPSKSHNYSFRTSTVAAA